MKNAPPFWFYVDDDKEIRGPFSYEKMLSWFLEGVFTAETLISAAFCEEDEKPTDMIEFDPIIERNDFLSSDEIQKILSTKEDIDVTGIEPSTVDESEYIDTSDTILYSDMWYYLDKQDNEQGPFTTKQITKWKEGGFLYPELLIRNGDSKTFYPLDLLPFSPFTQHKTLEKREEETIINKEWYYLDNNNHRQGPYSTEQMRYWFAKGFISYNNSKIRLEGELVYVTWNLHPLISLLVPSAVAVTEWDASRVQSAFHCLPLDVFVPLKHRQQPDSVVHKDINETSSNLHSTDTSTNISQPLDHPNSNSTSVSVIESSLNTNNDKQDPINPSIISSSNNKPPPIILNSTSKHSLQEQIVSIPSSVIVPPIVLADKFTSLIEQTHVGYVSVEWFYLDQQDKVQGPFAEQWMHQWFFQGLIPKDTKVRRVTELQFKSIESRTDCLFTLPNYTELFG